MSAAVACVVLLVAGPLAFRVGVELGRRRRRRETAELAAIESQRAYVVAFLRLSEQSYRRAGLDPPGWVGATIESGGVPVEPRRVGWKGGRRVVIPPDWSGRPRTIAQEPRERPGDPSTDPPSSDGPTRPPRGPDCSPPHFPGEGLAW